MTSPVSEAVTAYAAAIARLAEDQLTAELPDQPAEGEPWWGYVHDLRNVTLFLNLHINRLTSELRAGRQASRAAEICRQHHRAYRDLTGSLAGIGNSLFDTDLVPGEWPLRTIIAHITGAELGFSMLIGWAVQRQSADDDLPITMPQEEMAPRYGDYPETGTMTDVMGRYAQLHGSVIGDLITLDTNQLEALNVWWEGYEIPVWYRMHRFDAHLREHTVQIDKTLHALDRSPTEAERLARLLHQSLADLEIELALAGADAAEPAEVLARDFDARRRQAEVV